MRPVRLRFILHRCTRLRFLLASLVMCIMVMCIPSHQTREHFLASGRIVDNPAVGQQLTSVYWQPGNSEMFLDLVHKLTGKPLTGTCVHVYEPSCPVITRCSMERNIVTTAHCQTVSEAFSARVQSLCLTIVLWAVSQKCNSAYHCTSPSLYTRC